jgi:hypothetical protein
MAVRNILLKLTADPSQAERGLTSFNQKLEKFTATKSERLVELKDQAARTRLGQLQERLDRLSKQKVTPAVQLQMGRTATQIERLQRDLSGVERKGHSAGLSLRRLAGAAAGLGIGFAAFHQAREAVSVTEELAHATLQLHKNLGLDVQTASAWAGVARVRNVEAKQLAQSFGTLSKNIVAGEQGGKQQVKLLHQLGLSVADLKHQDFQTTLSQVADGLHRMGPGAERTALSMRLFGRGWQTVVPVLRDGSHAMREQLALAEKYGVTFRGKTVSSLENLIRAQREAKFATLGLQVAFGTELAPALTKAIKGVSGFVRGMRNGTGAGGRFERAVKPIANTIKAIVGWFLKHPHAMTVALGAWVAYKVGALKALGLVRSALTRLFAGQAARAAVAGEAAGTRFGRAFGPAAAVLIGGFLANYLQSLKWFRNLEQGIADKITGGHGITDQALNQTEDGLRRSIKQAQQTRPLGGPLADALATLPSNQPRPKRAATVIPTVGSGAHARALRLDLSSAERAYATAVRKYGPNSSAAIRAADAVLGARDAITTDAKSGQTTRRKRGARSIPVTPAERLELRAAQRYQQAVDAHGADSRAAKLASDRLGIAKVGVEVSADRGKISDAIRRFGRGSEQAFKAQLALTGALTRLAKANDKLKGAVDKNTKVTGALIPKATDIALPHQRGMAAMGRGGWHWGGTGGGTYIENVNLRVPHNVAPKANERYDATKLHRHLRRLGAALPA